MNRNEFKWRQIATILRRNIETRNCKFALKITHDFCKIFVLKIANSSFRKSLILWWITFTTLRPRKTPKVSFLQLVLLQISEFLFLNLTINNSEEKKLCLKTYNISNYNEINFILTWLLTLIHHFSNLDLHLSKKETSLCHKIKFSLSYIFATLLLRLNCGKVSISFFSFFHLKNFSLLCERCQVLEFH